MTNDIPKPTAWGDEYDVLRQMRELDQRARMGGVGRTRAAYTTQRSFVEVVEEDAVAAEQDSIVVQRYRVKTNSFQYLICRTWDGTTEGSTDVYVAKPPHLRVAVGTDFTQRTVTATPDGGGSAVPATETVTPAYSTNSEIFAYEPEGGTGVVTITTPNTAVTWLDINAEERQWLLPLRAIEVCVNGVPRKMVIRGGAPV